MKKFKIYATVLFTCALFFVSSIEVKSECGFFNDFCVQDNMSICRECGEDCEQSGDFGYQEYGSLKQCPPSITGG